MSFNKETKFMVKKITPLNNPEGKNWDILKLPDMIKKASKIIKEDEDLGGFDLKEAINKNPDFLYIKIFAIRKDEPNDNADAFSEVELKKSASTFIGVPLFTNHQNDDVEKARGECVHSWFDDDDGGIYIIGRVDKVAYPKLARGIETGYVTGSSMGTQVDHSVCSVCHNRAVSAEDYCDHIKNRKNRKFTGDMKCAYHDSPDVSDDEECPTCGSTKNNRKILKHSSKKIFEWNYGLKFIENSFVVNPACHNCGVKCVLNVPKTQKKVALLKKSVNDLEKYSNENKEVIEKIGGIKELKQLKSSMNNLESVVQSMLKQKENVSMEYVSDIVKAISDVQNVTDELAEMGYGKLPSPSGVEAPPKSFSTPSPNFSQPSQMDSMMGGQGENEQQYSPDIDTKDLNGLGTITKPAKSSKKIKDSFDNKGNLMNRVTSLDNKIKDISNREIKMSKILANASDKSNKNIVISQDENGEIFVTETNNDKLVKIISANQFNDKIKQALSNNPDEACKLILNYNNQNENNIGENMLNKDQKTKTAQTNNAETITEDQLDKQKGGYVDNRKDTPETITEGTEQMGSTSEAFNDTTSEGNSVRKKNTSETITEDQFGITAEAVIHYDDILEVITEKQWDDMSRLVSAKIADDYTDTITESQIKELLKSHQFVGNDGVITEKQFNENNGLGISRWASKDYTVSLLKTANKVIADAISIYSKSPKELKVSLANVLDNDKEKAKISFLSLVNSLPYKKQKRKLFASNSEYFNKKFAAKVISEDALVMAISENAKPGQKVEDILEYSINVLKNKEALAKVEDMINKKESKVDNDIDKESGFSYALKEINKPNDKLYRIYASFEDVKAPITDRKAFIKGLKKLAQTEIDDESVETAIIKIEVSEDGSLIIDVEDGAEEEITPEDIDLVIEGPVEDLGEEIGEDIVEDEESVGDIEEFGDEENEDYNACGVISKNNSKEKVADAKKEINKTAQLMGGEMGGQGDASQMPGAGGGAPMSPGGGAGQMGMESFTEQDAPDNMDMGDEEMEENLEAKPPGTACPVCTSTDVDVIDGKGKCKNCGSEFIFKVVVEIPKWANLTPEGDDTGEEGEEDDEFKGEGFKLPEDEEMPEVQMAAMTKIQPGAIKKIASEKIKLGSVSPLTGKTNTIDIGDGKHICLDTGTKYKLAFVTNKKDKTVWGQWEWKSPTKFECTSCKRTKDKIVKALSTLNITEAKFDGYSVKDKINTIKKLKKAGRIKNIKTASKNGSIIDEYKVVYGGYEKKFPIENCREKLARRFGKEAVALSGPCEGKNLADCVCNQLKKADVYTDNVAIKVASIYADTSGDEDCIEDQVREGHTLREASTLCETLKLAVASPVDMLADELGEEDGDTPEDDINDAETEFVVDETEDIDPFENIDDNETVSIEFPKELVEELDARLDTALGEDPATEEHHEEETINEVKEENEGIEDIGDTEIIEDEAKAVEDNNDEKGEVPGEQDIETEIIEDEAKAVEDNEEENGNDEEYNEEEDEDENGNDEKYNKEEDEEENGNDEEYNEEEDEEEYEYTEAKNMKSNINRTGRMELDLSSVAEVLNKKAKEVKQKNVQDVEELGNIETDNQEGSKIGDEKNTVKDDANPEIPRDNATIGEESEDLNPEDKPQPDIPQTDDATIGKEDEVGLEGGDYNYTGGDEGAGKTSTSSIDDASNMRGFSKSSSQKTENLAKNIKEAKDKKIKTKKLEKSEPVSKDKDIQPIQDNSTIGNEEKFDAEEPKNTKGKGNESQIGYENEVLGDRVDSPKDNAEIPADKQKMGKEELEPEKQTKNKGTVIAESESEAVRVAGKMLEKRRIKSSELQNKISELKSYKPNQIRDIEKAIFANNEKGLNTVSDGMPQAVVINEDSGLKKSQEEMKESNKEQGLTSKLASIFSLNRQNEEADNDRNIQLRKKYGKN